jgi:UDP-N-acetylmuramoyl-tripeptide--D-alanyl-D-alanine ligase
VFAISGSNGKTTHKEMLSFLLEAALGDRVVATEKNYNNHLGVPLTLLRITPQTEVCVLELGSNHPGEIKVLCDIARPHAGLVTNIGATHLEFFGTEERVFEEEGYLCSAVSQVTGGEGIFFLNLDDPFLIRLPRSKGTESFSRKPGADYLITPTAEGVKVEGRASAELTNLALTGTHNKQNMAVAWMIARRLFPQHEETFTRAAEDFRPTRNRSEWLELGGKKIFLDAYNANPSSMQTALEGFFDWMAARGNRDNDATVVLGDMNELGDGAPDYHRQVGQFLRRWPAARVAFVGRYASFYQEGLGGGEAFADAQSLKNSAWSRLTEGRGHVFVKGSRSLQLESLVDIT